LKIGQNGPGSEQAYDPTKTADFQNGELFEREDWTLFRSLATLPQKAGVPLAKLPALVCKELVDNSLDECGRCHVDLLEGENGFFVADEGGGIPGDDAEIARLFSIRRPLSSSKLVRLPSRGMLGNGLRVVAGLVLATKGSLVVATRGRKLKLMPRDDGGTDYEVIGTAPEQGTTVEVRLGPEITVDGSDLDLAEDALTMAQAGGPTYGRKTSPHWYDAGAFWELCQAAPQRTTVRALLAERFDGCSEPAAGQIVDLVPAGTLARELSREDAARILAAAQCRTKPVRAAKLGHAGEHALRGWAYRKELGEWNPSGMTIPVVVEAWADVVDNDDDAAFHVFINRTRVATQTAAWVEKDGNSRTLVLHGCALEAEVKMGRKAVRVAINVETPYVRLTSDGKTPELGCLHNLIQKAVSKAVGRARREARDPKQPCQKDAVLACLDEAVAQASGQGKYRFSLRRLYYRVRDLIKKLFPNMKELAYGWFGQIITAHEDTLGHDIPGIYRDSRGTLIHPHTREVIALGTLEVERYRMPEHNYNKILYTEKEGLQQILLDENWPERHDCALVSSKGFATRALRDLIDMIHATDPEKEVDVFCIHDCDGPGTLIYQALCEATSARPGRRFKIHDWGLHPEEALTMGLDPEPVERPDGKPVAVARDVPERWRQWYQKYRIEVDAMRPEQFLEWCDAKVATFPGKVIPPDHVMTATLKAKLEESLRAQITARILAKAGLDDQVQNAMDLRKHAVEDAAAILRDAVFKQLDEHPEEPWSKPVDRIALEIAEPETEPETEEDAETEEDS
jgi:hypothetical protein